MSSSKQYRQPPSRSQIGFELVPPDDLQEVAAGQRYTQHREDGRPIGELEIDTFPAALIIDRDGVLSAKASEQAGGMPAIPVKLPGASGYRAEAVGAAPLPYLYVFAMAPRDGVQSGLLVTVRSARPDWPAAEALLQSLRILTRNGRAPANDTGETALALPLVGPRDD